MCWLGCAAQRLDFWPGSSSQSLVRPPASRRPPLMTSQGDVTRESTSWRHTWLHEQRRPGGFTEHHARSHIIWLNYFSQENLVFASTIPESVLWLRMQTLLLYSRGQDSSIRTLWGTIYLMLYYLFRSHCEHVLWSCVCCLSSVSTDICLNVFLICGKINDMSIKIYFFPNFTVP